MHGGQRGGRGKTDCYPQIHSKNNRQESLEGVLTTHM